MLRVCDSDSLGWGVRGAGGARGSSGARERRQGGQALRARADEERSSEVEGEAVQVARGAVRFHARRESGGLEAFGEAELVVRGRVEEAGACGCVFQRRERLFAHEEGRVALLGLVASEGDFFVLGGAFCCGAGPVLVFGRFRGEELRVFAILLLFVSALRALRVPQSAEPQRPARALDRREAQALQARADGAGALQLSGPRARAPHAR